MADNKIKGKFIFTEDYKERFASGVYGGFTPSGNIIINFFNEKQSDPTTFEIDEKDLKKVVSISTDNSLVRTVNSAVIMNYESAKSLSDWLKHNISIYEEMVVLKKK